MKEINVGIIGIGFGQQVHVPAFRAHPQCKVVAICASQLERAKKVADRLQIPKPFSDWQAMIDDPEIDAIAIAVPPVIQSSIIMAALAKRKPILCEKPLAMSSEATQTILTAALHAQVAAMVDFWFPENVAWTHAKSMLDTGKIGQLRHIVVLWQVETYANKHGLTSWKTEITQGGGTLYSFLSHTFHYVEWLGGAIKSLSARLSHAPQDKRTGDTLNILCLELESGVHVSICISSHAFLGNGHRVELYGEEGTLVLDNSSSDYNDFRLLYSNRLSNQLDTVPLSLPINHHADGRILPVSQIINKFIKWIDTGVPQSPSFVEGMRVQQLLSAAQRSHQLGHWITLP